MATIGSFLAAVVAMVGFLLSSRSHPTPLIEPAYLRVRSFTAGNTLTLIASAGFYAYLLTHVLFLNYVWHYNLLRAGLAVAPAAFVAAIVAAVLGRVADRRGYRPIIIVGALIWTSSLLWYIERVGPTPHFLTEWLPGQILQGIGVGATLPILGSAALTGVAAGGSYATASAAVSSTRQLGAVIGIALLVIVVGTPARGVAEEALRRGWVLAAICFALVAIGGVGLGRARNAFAEAAEVEPALPTDPLVARLAGPTRRTRRDSDRGGRRGRPAGRSAALCRAGPGRLGRAARPNRASLVESGLVSFSRRGAIRFPLRGA